MAFGLVGKKLDAENNIPAPSENSTSKLSTAAPPSSSSEIAESKSNEEKTDVSKDDASKKSDEASTAADGSSSTQDKYWLQPIKSKGGANMVVIHVCDENRRIKKDFVCKRDVLVAHMKYFESFLQDSESGYDDIDISVHCDVEIFEWLMAFIHEPENPPMLDKTIVVSILISSEFLQMDALVDICLEHVSKSLNDIIRLPIDLSCISEKLVNKLAFMISPQILAQTKDRKDKILNKLYKRRVELDFSRKAGSRGGARSIAASLTCCQNCGFVYLEMYEKQLHCKKAKPFIDFRGRLVKRHLAIPTWSLTSYLKALHAGGMNWESIYWHVWAACQVLKIDDVVFSALETGRYSVLDDSLLVRRSPPDDDYNAADADANTNAAESEVPSTLFTSTPLFLLDSIPKSTDTDVFLKLKATLFNGPSPNPYITSTLNPARPPNILDNDIFLLIQSQIKQISGGQYRDLIDNTGNNMADIAKADKSIKYTFANMLWGDGRFGRYDEDTRGRSRSPLSGGRSGAIRRQTVSVGASVKNREAVNNGLKKDSGAATDRRQGRVPTLATRSRSMGPRGVKKDSNKNSDDEEESAESAMGDETDEEKAGIIHNTANSIDVLQDRHSALLKAMPPDLMRRAISLGPINGIWLEEHPLKLSPAYFPETMAAIQNTNLSERKKAEWENDMIRDTDEKRIERLEEFLVAHRDNNVELQLRSTRKLKEMCYGIQRKREDERTGKYNYYRDKGRQPTKLVTFM